MQLQYSTPDKSFVVEHLVPECLSGENQAVRPTLYIHEAIHSDLYQGLASRAASITGTR